MDLNLTQRSGSIWLSIRVQPRASRTEIVGVIAETGALKIRLKAPPVDGAANRELLKFLGRKVLRIPPSRLEIVRGKTGRDKVISIDGATLEEVRKKLAPG